MMTTVTPALPQKIVIEQGSFELINERRNGCGIYRSDDGFFYTVWGPSSAIGPELTLYKKVAAVGYPLAPLCGEGVRQGNSYYITKSVGTELIVFELQRETDAGGVTKATFEALLTIMIQCLDAQSRLPEHRDWEALKQSVHVDGNKRDWPKLSALFEEVWEKVQSDLREVPFCVTHGDFNPFNIFRGGVIDLENAYAGPLGLDIASCMTTTCWFPREHGFEYQQLFRFSPENVEDLFRKLADKFPRLCEPAVFNALVMARASWATYGMAPFPKLQEWRYLKFEKYARVFLEGKKDGHFFWIDEK